MPEPTITQTVSFFHPDIDVNYAAGVGVGATHMSIQAVLASELPVSHPNVDTLLRNPTGHPLPGSWHPNVSSEQLAVPLHAPRHLVVAVTVHVLIGQAVCDAARSCLISHFRSRGFRPAAQNRRWHEM